MLFGILSSAYKFLTVWLAYYRSFFVGSICSSKTLLNGKTVIITGGNSGIGKETALDLARRGAKVIIACRDMNKADNAIQDIREKVPDANIIMKYLDLASFASIRKFSEDILKTEPYIHILINNAGIAFCSKSKTEDGFEMQFGVNHLGHFLLTTLLLDRIKASAPARIVTVSSILHIAGKFDFSDINMDRNYEPGLAYCRSKLANILFARELAKKLEGTGVTTYCLHPGAVDTDVSRYASSTYYRFLVSVYKGFSRLFLLSPYLGAQTTIYCAVEESLATETGLYYCICRKLAPFATARDDKLAKELWDVSERLVAKSK